MGVFDVLGKRIQNQIGLRFLTNKNQFIRPTNFLLYTKTRSLKQVKLTRELKIKIQNHANPDKTQVNKERN